VLTGPDGIIPARAGSTERPTDLPKLKKDHPRSRGVHQGSSEAVLPLPGSSPLARGPPLLVAFRLRLDGIIPARAGSTGHRIRPDVPCQDHPRSRGVHATLADLRERMAGSSPLARGPLSVTVIKGQNTRIIPARAGSTTLGQRIAHAGEDHPRSRGVHCRPSPASWSRGGSSPLARGPPARARRERRFHRIIPARAGSTSLCPIRRRGTGDHPRSRGVHSRSHLVSIPSQDHPRSRGVHPAGYVSGDQTLGSSPLARGPLTNAESARKKAGIIPARAGSTNVSYSKLILS